MTYNKSEIMKKAWSLFHTTRYATFSDALSQAWREAKRTAEKRAQGYVMATELNVGDTVAVNGYGGYDNNNFTATITSIETITFNKGTVYEKSSLVFNFISKNGMAGNFCSDHGEMIKRTAQAPAVEHPAA